VLFSNVTLSGEKMKFLHGITLLLIYQLLGEMGVHVLQLSVPGPVLGMLLLFVTLLLRKGNMSAVESAATDLLSHLSLLFIPAGVGLMVYVDLLSDEWIPIVAALILGTLITLVVSALLMQTASRLFSKETNDVG
jgi:holin-like protein